MEKIIIAAMDENQVIGRNGEIPWYYPEDLEHFREKTTGHPVVMGRKTYFSLPGEFRPLPDRKNIVLSKSDIDLPGEVEKVESFEEAWKEARKHGEKVFIAGGASIYRQTLDEADRMILTEVHDSYEGDTFFPEWNEENWKEVERDDRGEISFVEYVREV